MAKLFDKILIANRGEIACRVIRSARKLGIKTVAVYSDADARGLHVQLADEAYRLGPPPAAESYLLADRIIEIARETGAQAIHPGYGFLSERASFAQQLEDAGIAFIGPPAAAIAAMGDKIESKKLAKAAGVSVVPGYVGEIRDTDHAVEIADDIGYPVMMKASAGGGGKGMRLAYSAGEVREGFDLVRREAKSSFGDDRIFIEKFVEHPRHIEIQLIGDKHGNVLWLNERDCSIQRRHQKVVEESPSPFATPEMRRAMGEEAVALAKKVGYFSAGTVEFVVGGDRSFYFLEMNTRLQVEHPVTEYVTGLDLVELMIKVAAGEKLPLTQADVPLLGHAIETRFYAEDPYRGFLPAIGRLVHCVAPPTGKEVRVDTGITEGSEISIYYDPMIAKVITHAPTREAAADLQIEALDRYYVRGFSNNSDFLSALMQHPVFRAGEHVTTAFIAEEYPDGFDGAPTSPERLQQVVAVAAVIGRFAAKRAAHVDGRVDAAEVGGDFVVELDGDQHPVHLVRNGNRHEVRLDGRTLSVETISQIPYFGVLEARVDGQPLAVQIDREGAGFRLTHHGRQHRMRLLTPRAAELAKFMLPKVAPDLSRYLLCPMPGLVVSVAVKEGDVVEAGQPLAVVEAMKMENILRAEKKATVARLAAKPGDSLAVDDVILEFEA